MFGKVLSMVFTKPLVLLGNFVLIIDPPGLFISSILIDVLLLLQVEITDVLAISRRYIFSGGGKNKLRILVVLFVLLIQYC